MKIMCEEDYYTLGRLPKLIPVFLKWLKDNMEQHENVACMVVGPVPP